MYNQQEHLSAITSFLTDVNARKDNPYILKGGTALSLCYALNRFSEDIDLDVAGNTMPYGRFINDIQRFCNEHGYSYRISKDTATTQRAYVNYGNEGRPLKIEVSYRRKIIPNNLICVKNGIQVYTLDEMARLKAAAYNGRDKIRDLYDVAYICTHYYEELSDSARDALRTALEYKEIEQFDYIVNNQKDELINVDTLETMFLESFDKLGLLNPRTSNSPLRLSEVVQHTKEVSQELNANDSDEIQPEHDR